MRRGTDQFTIFYPGHRDRIFPTIVKLTLEML